MNLDKDHSWLTQESFPPAGSFLKSFLSFVVQVE